MDSLPPTGQRDHLTERTRAFALCQRVLVLVDSRHDLGILARKTTDHVRIQKTSLPKLNCVNTLKHSGHLASLERTLKGQPFQSISRSPE